MDAPKVGHKFPCPRCSTPAKVCASGHLHPHNNSAGERCGFYIPHYVLITEETHKTHARWLRLGLLTQEQATPVLSPEFKSGGDLP